MTALSPTIRRVPEAEAALIGSDGGADADRSCRRGGVGCGDAHLRRPRLGRLPARDGRRDRAAARSRRRSHARRQGGAHEGRDDAERERDRLPGRARARHEPARRRARRRRADRLQGGLRRLRVRRLHDAARRPAGELVLLPRAPGRGQRDHDRRGPRRRRHPCAAAGGLSRSRRRPVRLLHARDARLRDRAPREQPVADRGRGADRRSPATSAAAPATTASSRPCSASARPADAQPPGLRPV